MKKLGMLAALMVASYCANAQNYNWAVGLRVGDPNGITVKKTLGGRSAFEGILSLNSHGMLGTALYEIHNPFLNQPGLNWFYGIGGHFGAWDHNGNSPFFGNDDDTYAIGADGILGVEYTFAAIPFNIGIDWKPAFNIAENPGLYIANGALSIRFAI